MIQDEKEALILIQVKLEAIVETAVTSQGHLTVKAIITGKVNTNRMLLKSIIGIVKLIIAIKVMVRVAIKIKAQAMIEIDLRIGELMKT